MKMSFYDWCLRNSRQDLLDRWDYNLNDKSPAEISWGTNKKFYFLCDKHKEHHSTPKQVCALTSGHQNILCKECQSFAQWVIDNYNVDYLNKIWNYDLNQESPYELAAKSHIPIYLNCDKVDYHKGYETTPARYTRGQKKCGFCHGLQVHPKDSFAQYNIDKFGIDFLDLYWDYEKNTVDPFKISSHSGQKVWIKCLDVSYHMSYDVRATDFSSGKSSCPYCRSIRVHPMDSVLFYYPNIMDIWSDKNIDMPDKYSLHSSKKVWLKCSCRKHEDYLKSIREAIECDFNCPSCSRERTESYLQEKVRTYISQTYDYQINHEHQCDLVAYNEQTKHYMPYDNEIIISDDIRLIIEVHGEQHYKITPFAVMQARYRNTTPEQALADQQYRDKIKEEYARSKGYRFLVVPYWTERDGSYKTIIDDKIHKILSLTQQSD